MKLSRLFAIACLAFAALPALAQQPAVTITRHVSVRAGPDNVYPTVAVLPPRAEVTVFGCLSDRSWCDIGYGIDRGWIYSGNLRYYYQNQWVPLAGVATVVGIGLTAFIFDDYWGRHYRERRFYNSSDRWYHGPPRAAWAPHSGFAPQHGGPEHRQFAPAAPIAPQAPMHGRHPQGAMQPVAPMAPMAPQSPRPPHTMQQPQAPQGSRPPHSPQAMQPGAQQPHVNMAPQHTMQQGQQPQGHPQQQAQQPSHGGRGGPPAGDHKGHDKDEQKH